MNIGPRADGSIPDAVQKILLEVGAWLTINGEAIYGTRPWKIFGEGPTQVEGGDLLVMPKINHLQLTISDLLRKGMICI
ncbi:MAG: alpha-L-fucosidase [Saprospiraceae bacterium]|nr:alpha-L-fucosidase [Saprospiraceae bacterium]